jgi:hypothetical protein
MKLVAPVTIYLYKNNSRTQSEESSEGQSINTFFFLAGNENEVLKIKIEGARALPERA